jgi:hypothetical protein
MSGRAEFVRRLPWIRLILLTAVFWFALARRRPRPQPPEPVELLRRSVPQLSFRGMPLGEAIDRLSRASGVRIDVDWPALAAIGISRDDPVTCGGNLSLGHAIDLVLDHLHHGHQIKPHTEGDHVLIALARDEADGGLECGLYDVSDLLADLKSGSESSQTCRFQWQPRDEDLSVISGGGTTVWLKLVPPVHITDADCKWVLRDLITRVIRRDRFFVYRSHRLLDSNQLQWASGGRLIFIADHRTQRELAERLARIRGVRDGRWTAERMWE